MIGYCKEFDYSTAMNFIRDDKTLFKKYKEEWEKIRSIKNKEFTSEPTFTSEKVIIHT